MPEGLDQEPAQQPGEAGGSSTPSAPPRPDNTWHARFRLIVAAFIVLVSISEAFVTWRAAVDANRASDLDQQAMQELLLRHREGSAIQGNAAQDIRLFERYQEDVLLGSILQKQQAQAAKEGFSGLAGELGAEFRASQANALRLQRLFTVQEPSFPYARSDIELYSPKALIQSGQQDDQTILGVHPTTAFDSARREHDVAVRLVGIAALLAASLVFLTLAQIGRRASRHVYGVAGVLVWVAGMVLFAVAQAAS